VNLTGSDVKQTANGHRAAYIKGRGRDRSAALRSNRA